MNNFGPRMLMNILAGGALATGWLWVLSHFADNQSVAPITMIWGVMAWAIAITYILSYRLPALRRKLYLPISLPICSAAVAWGYYQVATELGRAQAMWLSWCVLIPVVLLVGPLVISSLHHWVWRSRWFRENLRYGDGDNAQWATRSNYHKYEIELPKQQNGQLGWLDHIYLGMTQFRHDVTPRHMGIKTDVHLYTLGMSGSGKSSTSAWINYALYGGAAFIIDLKREHFKITGRRRAELGPVYNCDFLGIDGAKFNPLADVNLDTEEGLRLISTIRNAIILPEINTASGPHFADNAGTIFEGIATWVCATFPEEHRNLVSVYRILNSKDPVTGAYDPEIFASAVAEMSECRFGVCSQAAKLLDDAGDREAGSFLTTLSKSIKWMSSPQMQDHLSKSDFSMRELATPGPRKPTVYVGVGLGNEHDYQRYIRLMTATAIFHVRAEYRQTGIRPKPSVLFGLDEYPLYAKDLDCIATGFGTLREAGILLWVMAQKRSQVKQALGEGASLLEQNSTVQVFGVNNDEEDVAAWVSAQLGYHMITKKKSGEKLFSSEKVTSKEPLMTRRAVQDALSQHSRNQFVFPADGGPPMWLSRMAYKSFKIDGKQVFQPLALGNVFD